MKRTPNKTTVLSTHEKKEVWHLIDAKDETLGKVAAKISKILIGKNSARYVPNQNWGDKVVVINADKFKVTGKKLRDKEYIHYTGFPGGLRTETLDKLLSRKPTEVIKRAVSGMLPKNKLRKQRMANLYIYVGGKHPHEAQLTK